MVGRFFARPGAINNSGRRCRQESGGTFVATRPSRGNWLVDSSQMRSISRGDAVFRKVKAPLLRRGRVEEGGQPGRREVRQPLQGLRNVGDAFGRRGGSTSVVCHGARTRDAQA